MGDFTMLRLEKNGDEARKMLRVGGAQLTKLERYFKRYGKKLNLLIFSGGGNDILGENLTGLLRQKTGTLTWRDCIDDATLAARLAEITAAYENLPALRDRTSRGFEIVTHTYDYLVPDGRGAPVPFGLARSTIPCRGYPGYADAVRHASLERRNTPDGYRRAAGCRAVSTGVESAVSWTRI